MSLISVQSENIKKKFHSLISFVHILQSKNNERNEREKRRKKAFLSVPINFFGAITIPFYLRISSILEIERIFSRGFPTNAPCSISYLFSLSQSCHVTAISYCEVSKPGLIPLSITFC